MFIANDDIISKFTETEIEFYLNLPSGFAK